jgi:hypothetical protein
MMKIIVMIMKMRIKTIYKGMATKKMKTTTKKMKITTNNKRIMDQEHEDHD